MCTISHIAKAQRICFGALCTEEGLNDDNDDDDDGDEDDTLWIHTPHKKLKQKLMQWSQNIDEQVRASKRRSKQAKWANKWMVYVCLRNVCLYSLPSARSHKNYRHEFQSAFSNNKLGCLFLYGSFLVHFFFPLSFFSSFFFPSFFPSVVWVCEFEHEWACVQELYVSFTFPLVELPLFESSESSFGEVTFLQLIVFTLSLYFSLSLSLSLLSQDISFFRLSVGSSVRFEYVNGHVLYILRRARVAFQKWLMRTYIILLIA